MSVVFVGGGIFGDRHDDVFNRRNGQCAVLNGNVVVVGIRAFLPFPGESIFDVSGIRDAAGFGERDDHTVVFHEPGRRRIILKMVGNGIVGERRSVVFLRGASGNDDHGTRIDHQPAVRYIERNVKVGVVVGKFARIQPHIIVRACLRAVRNGDFVGTGEVILCIEIAGVYDNGVVAGNALLTAVVRNRGGMTRDVHGNFRLIDGQRAVLIRYTIIGRNSIYSGRIDCVRLRARIGDGGFCGHGQRNAILAVACQQSRCGKAGFGQSVSVVGLACIVGLQSQRHGVIDRDDVLAFVSRDRDGLRAVHGRICIFRVQFFALFARQGCSDHRGSGLIVRNFGFGVLQVMVNGILRRIQLEIQLQNQRTVSGDCAGKHVVFIVRFEYVLVFFPARLVRFGNGNSGIRSAFALNGLIQTIRSVRILMIELNIVLRIGIGSPYRIQVIVVADRQPRGSAARKGNRAPLRSRPAPECIAGAIGKASVFIGQNRDCSVCGRALFGNLCFLGLTEIGMIGHADRGSNVRIHGGQNDALDHPDALTGVIPRGCAGGSIGGLPVDEHLALGRGCVGGESQRLGFGVVLVFMRVLGRSACAVAQIVGHFVINALYDGADIRVRVKPCGNVECFAGSDVHPFENYVVGTNLAYEVVVLLIVLDGRAIGDCKTERIARVRNFHVRRQRNCKLRLFPQGVEDEVARRHRLVFKVVLLRLCIRHIGRVDRIPALEHGVLRKAAGTLGVCVVAGHGSAVLNGCRRFSAVIVVCQGIAVAQVVECQRISTEALSVAAETCNACGIARKALNFVILLVVGGKVEVSINCFQQVKVGGAGRPCVGGYIGSDLLDIVGDGFFRVGRLLIEIECRIKARHAVERLKRVAVLACFRALPRAAVIGRVERCLAEFAGNLRVVFGGNGGDSAVFVFERQRIGFAIEIHVQNGRAVRQNLNGFTFFGIERIISPVCNACGQGFVIRGVNRIAGFSRPGRGCQRGIVFIVRVLSPIHDGEFDVCARPNGIDQRIILNIGNRSYGCRTALGQRPAAKGIALARKLRSGKRND